MVATCLGFSPLPPEGHVSVCEIDGKVCHKPFESASPIEFTSTVSGYPSISLSHDAVHMAAGEDARHVFLHVEEKLLKRIMSTWYEQGAIEALQLASSPSDQSSAILQWSARLALKTMHVMSLAVNTIFPTFGERGQHTNSTGSQAQSLHRNPVRFVVWHPHCTKIAVAVSDDSVRVYAAATPGFVPTLRSKLQRSVTCLAWRPHSASELAVGCHAGVLVWQVDPKSVVTRPSITCATVLKRPGHSPITSIQWNSTGTLLVSAASSDSSMYIWDVDLQESVPLRRVGGGGVNLLSWSPDVHKLLAATTSVTFRVWNTSNWVPERWRVLSGYVRSACWSPCSTILLFTTSEESVVYALQFKPNCAQLDTMFYSDTPVSEQGARVVINLEPEEVGNGLRIGGPVMSMVWDKLGRHLALIFENSSLVAVYRTDLMPHLLITPCCLVKGASGEQPTAIAFQSNFDAGACLTIAWSTGRIQYFPMVYQELKNPSQSIGHNDSVQFRPDHSIFESSRIHDGSLLQSFHDSFLSY
ncbi:aladin [Frankliniella occidentalis]|uniref:Aladin n=1 Tax=Frankliniella occidentalis TaxID=133901 RepID=A0A6J1T306_FRAOC|nr:aladin [Frankliniella occidentalis]XP_052126730.1 aladin [Frankliniella occidentalis]XP_052126731.1 aladin [Frankliniella occidentalis]